MKLGVVVEIIVSSCSRLKLSDETHDLNGWEAQRWVRTGESNC